MNKFKKVIVSALLIISAGNFVNIFAIDSRFIPSEKRNVNDTKIGVIQMWSGSDGGWVDVLSVHTIKHHTEDTLHWGVIARLGHAGGAGKNPFGVELSNLFRRVGDMLTWDPSVERAGGLNIDYLHNDTKRVVLDDLDPDTPGLSAIKEAITALVAAQAKR